MKNSEFCHLHVHNEFSLLDGFGTAEAYAERAKKLGFKAVALTNHGNVDGVIKWQQACEKQGIQSIVGCEGYMVEDLTQKVKGEKRYHITLLVKNETGWHNLLKILTYANLNGFYYRPRFDPELFLEYSDGLLVMTACSFGFLRAPWGEDFLKRLLKKKVDVYAEIMPLKMEYQYEMNEWCLEISKKYKIPLVATNDCHYILESQSLEQEVLLAIQNKAKWTDKNRFKFDIKGLYLKTASEMITSFEALKKKVPRGEVIKALKETVNIAKKCQFKIQKVEVVLPDVVVPQYKDLDEDEQLINLCFDGLEARAERHSQIRERWGEYETRLLEELETIIGLGFPRYFLIVWELIKWCHENDIMTGPGRGSVGGCLVAYCLNITQVDPIVWNLIFSRFISAARIDLPDIDMDFEDIKRGQIRKHLEELYGKYNVLGVSTFMQMHGRSALRDVARVFDTPQVDVDAAANSIVVRSGGDVRADFTIEDAFQTFEDGKRFLKKYPKVSKLAMSMEGQIRGAGQHAAAMCVSGEDLRSGRNANYVQRNKVMLCNWDKEDAEYMGLMKLDVLGLNALTVLNAASKLIKERKGEEIHFDLIPLDDEKVFSEFTKGNNIGVFQFSSPGMTKLCREILVEDFEQLIALNALHRPGCLRSGMTQTYRLRKHGEEKVSYIHDYIKNIAEHTQGLILYQEQIMRLLYDLGGLPWKTADMIRKVISKSKGVEQFKKFEKLFIDGCKERKTLSPQAAKKVFDELKYFGSYGFNRAHATEYALIAYWEQWLKVHYPTEIMTALLSYGSDTKKAENLTESRRIGLKVLLPKINESNSKTWIPDEDNNILVPLQEIKGLGPAAAKAIIKERSENGPYKSYEDFDERVPKRQVNSRVKSLLTKVGAFEKETRQLTDADLDELSIYFNFELSNDPMFRFRKILQLLYNHMKFTYLKDIDPIKSTDKKMKYYFGRMAELKFGYREKVQKKSEEVEGVVGALGGVYGNYEDETDFMMLVFGKKIYERRKYEIEHCEGQWLLVKANYPYKTSSIHAHDVWFDTDLLTGNLTGLGIELAEKSNPKEFKEICTDIKKCRVCDLRDECRAPVLPSKGGFNMMAIGEAPWTEEDKAGQGFVGKSGRLLWPLLLKRGIERDWLYVSNVIKCAPLRTKKPKKIHVQRCGVLLDREIKAIKPFVIFAMGNTCNLFFRGEDSGIMSLSGTTTWSDKYGCWLCWSIHPAMAARHIENKAMLEEGLDNFVSKVYNLGFGLEF